MKSKILVLWIICIDINKNYYKSMILRIMTSKRLHNSDNIMIQRVEQIFILVDTEQNKLTTELVQTVNQYNNQVFSNITSNDLFKQNNQQNEEIIITICEIMLKQGYDLRTDANYDKFQILKDKILDNSIEKHKSLYIQSRKIPFIRLCYCIQITKKRIINSQWTILDKLIIVYEKSISQILQNKRYRKIENKIKLALLYFEDQKYLDAIQMYDVAIKIDPNMLMLIMEKVLLIILLISIGESLRCLQKYQQAIEMFEQAIKIAPKQVFAYHNKGSSYQYYSKIGSLLDGLQKYQQAIQMYDEAIKIDPKYAYAYNDKGVSLDNLQKYEEAIDMYDQAIKIDNKYIEAYYNKGYSLNNLQKYQQAIQVYDEAINLDPKYAPAYLGKGQQNYYYRYKKEIRLVVQKDTNKPLRCLMKQSKQILNLFKLIMAKVQNILQKIGNSLRSLQKYQQAIEMYDKAITIDLELANAHYNKAISLYQLNQYQQAKFSFEKYLDYSPNDDDTKQMIKQCEQQIQS
ncbi:hypothetical protein pb186bvf_015980 [Paramecium bursaria]